MKSFIKFTITFLIAIVAIAIIAIVWFTPKDKIESIVKEEIVGAFNCKADYSSVKLDFFSTFPKLSVSIKDFCLIDTIRQPYDTILSLKKAQIQLNIEKLINYNEIDIIELAIQEPFLHYKMDSISGESNLTGIIKLDKNDSDTASSELIEFKEITVSNGRFKYNEQEDISNLSFIVSGSLNQKDSILKIDLGKILVKNNSLDFYGFIDKDSIDFNLKYKIYDISRFTLLAEKLSYPQLNKVRLRGIFVGDNTIRGKFADEGNNPIIIQGNMTGNNISVTSSKSMPIVKRGKYDIDYHIDFQNYDSSYLNFKEITIEGDDIFAQTSGTINYRDNDYQINCNLSSRGNLTKFIQKTSLVSKGKDLSGEYDIYMNISSSLKDLKTKYHFPKDLNSKRPIELPNFFGELDLKNFNLRNDSITVFVHDAKFSANGNKSHLVAKMNQLSLAFTKKHSSKYLINVESFGSTVNGVKKSADITLKDFKFSQTDNKDTIALSMNKSDISLQTDRHADKLLNGSFENVSITKNDTRIFCAKINSKLNRDKKGELWNGGVAKVFIASIQKKDNLSAFCTTADITFDYIKSKICNIKGQIDTLDITQSKNKIIAKEIDVFYDDSGKAHFTANIDKIHSKELDYGIGLDVNKLKAAYNNERLSVSTEKVRLGKSNLTLDASITFEEDKPHIIADLSGKCLDLNEFVYSNNRHALANNVPTAIPLDSIPKGAMPRMAGKPDRHIALNLDFDTVKISSLNMANAKGKIRIIGYSTLIDSLTSKTGNTTLSLTTLYRYIDPDHCFTIVNLKSKNLTMEFLRNTAPSLANASPMLSALHGTIDFSISMRNNLHRIISMNLEKAACAVSMEAKDLSISDNEEFRKIAKTLMFKNRDSTEIDSLSVAAEIVDGKLKILPFMLKVDRYKVAMSGENKLKTDQIDYHISILKSPIPFMFGINISGEKSPYNIKLVKTMYKKMNPSIKPWTDQEFVTYKNKINEPLNSFKKTVNGH